MLSIGIVGLPNVGKSTLFNALTHSRKADAQNYPFCTIEPNVGIVEVPDKRLAQLSAISHSLKTVPTAIEFVDIAGLVKGASEGEGLGNKFLSHIRETNAIIQVVRAFEDKNIIHVSGEKANIKDDIETINLELILSDMDTVAHRLNSVSRLAKTSTDKKIKIEAELFKKIAEELEAGRPIRGLNFNEEEIKITKELNLLSQKPLIYAVNCSEDQLSDNDFDIELKKIFSDDMFVKISAKLEQELIDLDEEEAKAYLNELGIGETGLDKMIATGYKILNLISFFTSGEPETRAWTVKIGAKAPEAAGVIHTDFISGFIKAEVANCNDFIETNGWSGLKEKGKMRLEGKEYVVKDGDVCYFHVKT